MTEFRVRSILPSAHIDFMDNDKLRAKAEDGFGMAFQYHPPCMKNLLLAQSQSTLHSQSWEPGVPNDLLRLKCGRNAQRRNGTSIETHGLDLDHVAPLDLGSSTKDKDLTLQSGGYIPRSESLVQSGVFFFLFFSSRHFRGSEEPSCSLIPWMVHTESLIHCRSH